MPLSSDLQISVHITLPKPWLTMACRYRESLTHNRSDTVSADAPNRVRAVDFQFDVTTDGRPIKIVSIIDEHTRECLGGMVERSITCDDLIAELDRLAGQRGTDPTVLRCCCAATTDPN